MIPHAAFTPDQDLALRRLLASSLTCRKMAARAADLARGWGVTVGAVSDRLDYLLGPAALEVARMSPVEQALLTLCGRAREDREVPGGFRLHGRPAGALEVMAAANAVRGLLGLPDIAYPLACPKERRHG